MDDKKVRFFLFLNIKRIRTKTSRSMKNIRQIRITNYKSYSVVVTKTIFSTKQKSAISISKDRMCISLDLLPMTIYIERKK